MTADSPLVLLTGATGSVGVPVAQHLLRQGYQLRLVARNAQQLAALWAAQAGCTVLPGDLTDPNFCAQAVQGVWAVCHLAAQLHLNNPTPAQQVTYRAINLEASQYLAQAAQAAHVSRFIFASTISVYGRSHPPAIFTEDSPLQPQTRYAQTKVAAEQAVQCVFPAATVLRLAAVYGPNMQGNYHRLAAAVRRGRFVHLGDGSNRRTLVHQEDVARAIEFVLQTPQTAGQIYNVTDGAVVSVRQIVQAISAGWQRPTPSLVIPLGFIKRVLLPVRVFEKITGRLMLPTILLEKWLEDVAVSGTKFKVVGFKAHLDLAQGWQQTCQTGNE